MKSEAVFLMCEESLHIVRTTRTTRTKEGRKYTYYIIGIDDYLSIKRRIPKILAGLRDMNEIPWYINRYRHEMKQNSDQKSKFHSYYTVEYLSEVIDSQGFKVSLIIPSPK